MLTLLLILVLNHSVLAMGVDSNDVNFDLGYAILLGGLFVLLVYQLIPRRQRKISYEEQEDFEEEADDAVPQNNSEAEKDLDEDLLHAESREEENEKADEDPAQYILKTTPLEYSNALRSLIGLMAIKKSKSLMWDCPAAYWQSKFDEHTKTLKAGVAKKAVTMELLKRVCLRLARGFAATLKMSVLSLLKKSQKQPEEVFVARTSAEHLRILIGNQLFSETLPEVSKFPACYEDFIYAWLYRLETEGKCSAGPQAIEEAFVSLAEAVIDKLTVACSHPDEAGPDGARQANREKEMLSRYRS
ncbi:unnamed protein product, partial [Mesorhabditis spiculigera]